MEMSVDRRDILLSGLALAGSMAIPAGAALATEPAHGATSAGITPDQALDRLIEGNRRFVGDRPNGSDLSTRRRLALAKGQTPFAALVGCADSRVGPEHLLGAGLGELFIVRTAGNYVEAAGMGSLAYAVSALNVSLIVVMGHERCGAVDAALSVVERNVQFPAAISRMLEPILPAIISAKSNAKPGENLLDACVAANVRRVVAGLRQSSDPIMSGPIADGRIKVVGARYDLDTGEVDFFDRA
ncbi:MAG: carbonic anhydrase [Tardiphaga sp.]|nr:carbonic anhydrase [Tardiphaga sp.]